MKLLVDTKWNSGLYDYNDTTNELTKVLMFYKDEKPYYYRFQYSYNEETFKEATKKDIEAHKDTYFDDAGTKVFANT